MLVAHVEVDLAYWVYILRCENGALYTGYTDDLPKRYEAHLAGKGAKYTRSFRPIEIAQAWQINGDKSMAMRMESYIKRLSRTQKEALIVKPERLLDVFEPQAIDSKNNPDGIAC